MYQKVNTAAVGLGFTAILIWLAVWIAIIWTVVHFVAKFW